MKMKLKAYIVLLLFFGVNVSLFAQLCSLTGVVKESEHDKPLVGVNVIVEKTIMGTSTGLDGSYTINRIPAGNYTLIYSYIGYITQKVDFVAKSGENVCISVTLKPGPIDISSILVEADRPYSAASSGAIRKLDMVMRPKRSAQELLRLVPGLFIAQHAGGGKAEQIFLRGFDNDHGTDVAIDADGVPVNMVSHGHGQGYADLHFVIPELVEKIEVHKGPFSPSYGNLATAGAISLTLKDHIDHNLVSMEGGYFNSSKITTIMQIPLAEDHQNAYFAGQYYRTDGPFESPQGFQRFNIYGRFHTHLSSSSELAISLSSFASAWDASGQVPDRAVRSGLINRFGTLDNMEGGNTSRNYVSLNYVNGEGSDDELQIRSYAGYYNFKLFSNFTFFLNDPVDGDMIEQVDRRDMFGINSLYRFRRSIYNYISTTAFSVGVRSDNINVSLWNSPDRIRKMARTDSEVIERNYFAWLEEEVLFSTMWRLQLGLRADYFTFNLQDRLENKIIPGNDLPHASGFDQEITVNPKLNLVFSPGLTTDLYLNIGSGFHSNDARDVILAKRMRDVEKSMTQKGFSPFQIDSTLMQNHFDPSQKNVRTLPKALSGEIGIQTRIIPDLIFTFSTWWLQMQEELVFVGDEGATEISGATQRIGLDFEARYQIASWLWADVDVNWAEGKYIDEPAGANIIPLAPRLTSTGGITLIHPRGWEGNLRFYHMADRSANEDNSVVAIGYSILNLNLGYRFESVKLFANFENLLNSDWNEAQFDTESRLKFETQPVSEIHFTPGNPFNFRVGFVYTF